VRTSAFTVDKADAEAQLWAKRPSILFPAPTFAGSTAAEISGWEIICRHATASALHPLLTPRGFRPAPRQFRRWPFTAESAVMLSPEAAPPCAETPALVPRDAATPICQPAVEDLDRRRRWAILAFLLVVSFLAQLNFFIVNPCLPAMSADFDGASLSAVSWVLNAYSIIFASMLVPVGRIADIRGRKRVLLSGIAVFTVASAVCALAPDLGVLIGGRAVQAIGAAMIIPTSLGLLYPSFPQRQHTLVVGIWAGVSSVATPCGPFLGGLIASVSWRWVFVLNLPIGMLALIVGALLLPKVHQPEGSRLPEMLSLGSLLSAVAFLVLATAQGPTWGWTSGPTVGLFVASAAATALTVQRSFHAAEPVIEKCLFESVYFTAATIAAFIYYGGSAVFIVGCTLFMQRVWHFSTMGAGLAMAPAAAIAVVFAVSAGPIASRLGRALPAVLGTMSMTAGAIYWMLMVDATPHYATAMLPGLVLMGISAGLTPPPIFAAANTLAADRATTGSAVINMSRQIGTAVGVAVLVALTATTPSSIGYPRAWIMQAITGVVSAVILLAGAASARRRSLPTPLSAPATSR
jgi:EmrB/QacA subfamily drug resistance transporter